MKKSTTIFAVAVILAACIAVYAAGIGGALPSVQLKNYNLATDKWQMGGIPYVGQKVISIMYTDVDVADMNDPLSNAIKAKKYPKTYIGIGIGNSKDAPLKPDVFIRSAAKRKMKQFPGSPILLDETHAFRNAMGLGDCNQKAVVVVVGKDRRIKYLRKISSAGESRAQTDEVLKVLDKELGVK